MMYDQTATRYQYTVPTNKLTPVIDDTCITEDWAMSPRPPVQQRECNTLASRVQKLPPQPKHAMVTDYVKQLGLDGGAFQYHEPSCWMFFCWDWCRCKPICQGNMRSNQQIHANSNKRTAIRLTTQACVIRSFGPPPYPRAMTIISDDSTKNLFEIAPRTLPFSFSVKSSRRFFGFVDILSKGVIFRLCLFLDEEL